MTAVAPPPRSVPGPSGATDAPPPASLRRLGSLIGPQRWWVVGTALLAFGTLASGVGLIAMAAYLISRSALVDSTATLALAITGVRFFAVTRATLRYAERYIGHLATFRVLTRLRVWFFRGIEPLAPARLADRRGGDLLSRILSDIDTLQDFALRVAVPVLAGVLSTVLVGVVLGSFSVALGVVVVAYLVVGGVVVPAAARRIGRAAAGEAAAARAALEAEAVESLSGLDELVAWGREDRLLVGVEERTAELCRIDRRLASLRAAAAGLGALLVGLAATTLLALAVPMVDGGVLRGEVLAAVPLVAVASFEAVLPVAAAMEQLGRARSAAARLDDLIDAPPAAREPALPVAPPVPAPGAGLDVVFDRVRFAYDPAAPPALSGATLRIPAGAFVAVLGPSGSGKSTLLSLLLRFWDPDAGRIAVGGVDLREMLGDDARSLVAAVAQHDHLFDTSVRDNLLLGDADADDERIRAALAAADALHMVDALPDGLDSRVGEDGRSLSGGERQRLMIARALLADAPVLVLDEATAHLDPATEARVLAGVREWHGARTLVVISHRATVAADADLVVRVDRGRCAVLP